jgi:hypothetical protein
MPFTTAVDVMEATIMNLSLEPAIMEPVIIEPIVEPTQPEIPVEEFHFNYAVVPLNEALNEAVVFDAADKAGFDIYTSPHKITIVHELNSPTPYVSSKFKFIESFFKTNPKREIALNLITNETPDATFGDFFHRIMPLVMIFELVPSKKFSFAHTFIGNQPTSKTTYFGYCEKISNRLFVKISKFSGNYFPAIPCESILFETRFIYNNMIVS